MSISNDHHLQQSAVIPTDDTMTYLVKPGGECKEKTGTEDIPPGPGVLGVQQRQHPNLLHWLLGLLVWHLV